MALVHQDEPHQHCDRASEIAGEVQRVRCQRRTSVTTRCAPQDNGATDVDEEKDVREVVELRGDGIEKMDISDTGEDKEKEDEKEREKMKEEQIVSRSHKLHFLEGREKERENFDWKRREEKILEVKELSEQEEEKSEQNLLTFNKGKEQKNKKEQAALSGAGKKKKRKKRKPQQRLLESKHSHILH